MATDPLDTVRQDLTALRARLVRGEIDLASYNQLREAVLADLTAEERAALSTGTPGLQAATPSPRTPPPFAPSGLGPSGASGLGLRTAIPRLADLDLQPGTVLLEQWRLVRELGRGGFGAVFEAEELHLHERQAVKVLDPAMVAKEELLARFRREVSLMRKLVHPRIVRVYDYREDPEQLVALISMELVRGGSVKQLLAAARAQRVRVPIELALEILGQTLEALVEAHSQGVIHRDVTPGNVLLAGGTPEQLLAEPGRDPQVKLVDFGIAGLVERSELSQKSRVLGTAAYVAPEVLDPSVEVTSAADVYGAGAMAYELLTGELPVGRFEGVRELRGEVTESLDHFVTSLLEKRPERRPQAKAGAWGLPGLREEAEQESQRRKAEQRRQPEEQARRQQETARREVEDNTQQVRRAAEWRAAAERTVPRRDSDLIGSQTARRKGPSAGVWSGIGVAVLALVLAVGWGMWIPSLKEAAKMQREEAVQRQRKAEVAAQRQREEKARSLSQPSGTWRDDRSGLLWAAKDNGSNITWDNAKGYCDSLTLGGFSDWRLPSIGELDFLYDESSSKKYKTPPNIELTERRAWSKDLLPNDFLFMNNMARFFYFDIGERSYNHRSDASVSRALCVRGSGG